VSLLEALREDLGITSVKDGCSPQGQCGCCTVLIDGSPRVACVTAVRRARGRDVRTVDGIDPASRDRLVDGFLAHGASQCGFCTPGILCRLSALPRGAAPAQVENALLAHLCRCTGWRSIVAAATAGPFSARPDPQGAVHRAGIEGGVPQRSGADVVLGRGGFADDTAPQEGCLVAVPDGRGGWAVGETLAEARGAAGKVQGRRSGHDLQYPIEVPPGTWDLTLQTTWVEPAYLEPDSSWCLPGGEPASPVANGGAFGGKLDSQAPEAARRLADQYNRPVRVVYAREDVVRLGPKRPPIAAGLRLDGSGVIRIAAGAACDWSEFPRLTPEHFRVPGPAVSSHIRGAGWAEAAALTAATSCAAAGRNQATVVTAEGGQASASVSVDDYGWPTKVEIAVDAGDPLDPVTLSSYVQGAAHMALGWVCSEGIAVDPETGQPEDLTIRSFGVIRAKDTPSLEVSITTSRKEPKRVSDAVFAAVAAATWVAQGLPSRWPTKRGLTR
jgi:xanthine dehydrogenase small subunit